MMAVGRSLEKVRIKDSMRSVQAHPNGKYRVSKSRARKERFLRRQAEQLGLTLTPVEGVIS